MINLGLNEIKCKTRVNLNFSKKKKKDKHGELDVIIQVENLEFL